MAVNLDSVRENEGAQACRYAFADACRRGIRAAAMMAGDILTYPTFFIILPEIENMNLLPYLSPLKRAAYDITHEILAPKRPSVFGAAPAGGGLLSERNTAVFSALKWMMETGHDENLGGEYDEALDVAASVLINLYGDRSVLPLAADMIFARGRTGRSIHDLSWAFFRSRDPEALKLIAKRMDSEQDSELACSLLGIEPDISVMAGNPSGNYLKWLEENKEYLKFTDECFQLTSRPSVFVVDLERKYMQKRAGQRAWSQAYYGESDDGSVLAAFRQLDGDEQAALSEYSQALSRDNSRWRAWMKLPLGEQLSEARKAGGVWL